MDIVVNGNHIAITTVIAIGLCWQILYLDIFCFMLFYLYGRWKATATDFIAICVEQVTGLVVKCGRWNSHMRVVNFILSS